MSVITPTVQQPTLILDPKGKEEEVEDESLADSFEALDISQELKQNRDAFTNARKIFRCSARGLKNFNNKEDPFNYPNKISGIMCHRDGIFGGSLYITHVNGQKLRKDQIIFGTPKLAYPYTKAGYDTQTYKSMIRLEGKCASYLISTKWNGTNVLIYKYTDDNGKVYVSAKSKGGVFIHNTQFGDFLDLTREALGMSSNPRDTIRIDDLPEILSDLKDPKIQSKTFELCGKKEPHLVKYDFSISLKPLFVSYYDGRIAPCIDPKSTLGPFPFDPKKMVEDCSKCQQEDLTANEEYRKKNNLKHRYEHNHFITEGRVLYLLDDQNRNLSRTMYKIKPKDIEEVHWGNFDATMQGRVREAVEKCYLRGKYINETSVREEMDMGPKEWGKFGKEVMKFVQELQSGELSRIHDKRKYPDCWASRRW